MSNEYPVCPTGYRHPLSPRAKKLGVRWLMGDGFKNDKEARATEELFLDDYERHLEGEKSRRAQGDDGRDVDTISGLEDMSDED